MESRKHLNVHVEFVREVWNGRRYMCRQNIGGP